LLATPLLFADPGQSPPPKGEREALNVLVAAGYPTDEVVALRASGVVR